MLMNRNENIGKMSSLCDRFRLFQAHICHFAVCLVNAMQAVVREGVTTLGESMTVTHKQTQAALCICICLPYKQTSKHQKSGIYKKASLLL